MNVKLLRKIQKHILAEPRRYDQDIWRDTDTCRIDAPPCGTVACIGGWAQVLSEKLHTDAAKLLDLNDEQAHRLMAPTWNTRGWPRKYREQYFKAASQAGMARAAARRIDHFIKTKGAE